MSIPTYRVYQLYDVEYSSKSLLPTLAQSSAENCGGGGGSCDQETMAVVSICLALAHVDQVFLLHIHSNFSITLTHSLRYSMPLSG